MVTNQSGSALV
jgi:hypothetical protein